MFLALPTCFLPGLRGPLNGRIHHLRFAQSFRAREFGLDVDRIFQLVFLVVQHLQIGARGGLLGQTGLCSL